MTVNPNAITNFGRNRAQLEELVLFGTLVAGKPAHRMAALLDRILINGRLQHSTDMTPFDLIRVWIENDTLGQVLRAYNVGQYTRIERCWRELTAITPCKPKLEHDGTLTYLNRVDLKSVAQLEAVHGIGPKTARFVVLHSVKGARCIPVDTHWLKELASLGYPVRKDVVVNGRTHAIYEGYALQEVDKSGLTCAAKDQAVWLKWTRTIQQRAA